MGRLLNKKYSVPDGCAEGVMDGRVDGLALGAVVGNPTEIKHWLKNWGSF